MIRKSQKSNIWSAGIGSIDQNLESVFKCTPLDTAIQSIYHVLSIGQKLQENTKPQH